MKYKFETLILLISLFLIAELFGLFSNSNYFSRELPYSITPPEWEPEIAPFSFMVVLIFATLILLFLMRRKANFLLNAWYFLALLICSSIGLASFLPETSALGIALILTIIRLSEPDIYIHNLSEILSYSGVTAIFLPLFTPITILILLLVISVYDFIAVHKTKHMIKLFQQQKSAGILPGILARYRDEVAFLGGGDVVFVMLFSTVMAKFYGIAYALISIYLATITIFLLGVFGERKKFYPAMPFLTSSCLLSFLIANVLK
ncbi:MAG: presenilin family intramembrane aspartyl protease [Candidatus Nanoarchaeia archaeon]|nr:presenilin family intramembrane aspartyl protease [Candidatus Haiyanarchaeum thermophilum]MCW1302888.1 presenilin family intramembrane aspartyl protease [Candidatus Haiyanarchaeum thermophilum]MCW1303567.1 presenilin family intramembrane aspartyl protease [Candidatus Haiyanarchaeum thermophilum]MCW1306249.1 presenilin family intramembrane aspartyl protease [Candidatus Haiyanarchaeum thermophilum]MCW1307515.1 presenilin family intramembrane aspartyl protease [Candidatus Haiyanarchaeum thermop